jgi:hypothetical protein
VVLFGGTGAYYTSQYTDDNGEMRRMRIPQWSMKGSFTNIWTPYKITVAKSGVTSTDEFVLDHDYTDAEALNFLLIDRFIPVIRITSPFPGDVFSVDDLTLRGFTTEVGSGIRDVNVYFTDDDGNDLPTVEVEVDENGDFTHTFSDLPEGENILMHAIARDIARNTNQTTVSIVIDRTSPWLQVHSPEDGITTNQVEIDILGDYEPGAMIKINGRERGDASGILNERYTLSEGNNTLIIEATDLAGNSAMVTRSLRLDRFSPTLTVLAPRDGLNTKVTNIDVEGDVEEGAEITVSVYRPNTDLINETIEPKPDGTFSHSVDLEEGENTIVVSATDGAGNKAQVTRKVYLDTTAPPCDIIFPPNGHVTNENIIEVRGTAEPTATLYLNGKQIFNSGTIQREVSLNEGDNIIELKVIDAIGNEYKHRVTVTLDTTAPEITMVKPLVETLKTNNPELQLVGIVTGGPHTLTALGINTEFDVDGNFDTTVTLPEEGMVEVVIEAKDLAGNSVTHTIFVDFSTTKPMLNIIYDPIDTDIKSEDSNFFIRGTTTPGVKEVKVTHTASGVPRDNTYAVGPDGSFSVARALLEGENAFTVMVVDSYGNMNESVEHKVNYRYVSPPGVSETKEKWDLTQISLLILVIALAFFATAIVVTRSTSRR